MEEYFTLTVGAGAPSYVDRAGGIHTGGAPQLLSVRRHGPLRSLLRRLLAKLRRDRMRSDRFGEPAPDMAQFCSEFHVEIPLHMDISEFTGLRPEKSAGIFRRLCFRRTRSAVEPAEVGDL